MDEGKIRTLLESRLGLRKVRRNTGGWFNATCPFESRHGGGKDENPSFGVHVAPHRSSKFNCKGGGCQINGDNLLALIYALDAHRVRTPVSLESTFWWVLQNDNVWLEIDKREDADTRRRRASNRSSETFDHQSYLAAKLGDAAEVPYAPDGVVSPLVAYEPPTPTVIPDAHLENTLPISNEALAYLYGPKRGLLPETVTAWELGSRGNRVSIPIRDYKQRLVGLSGRLLDGHTGGPKFLHSLGFRRDFFLYGESKVVRGGTGYITEGFFNVIGLWQSGYQNAVAIMGSYPSKHQVQKMVMFFDRVVILGDGDKAGREMALKVLEAVRPFLPARVVDMPEGKDPQHLTDEEKILLIGPPDRPFDNRNAV